MSLMTETLRPTVPAFQPVRRKPADSTRNYSSNSPFILEVRERITRDWLRGVSEYHLSKMYRVTREAIEATVRGQVLAMVARKTAYAVSLSLIALTGIESYEMARSDDQQTIQRAFRGRARRSRKEGELADSVFAGGWEAAA